jgi:hypothetical protein
MVGFGVQDGENCGFCYSFRLHRFFRVWFVIGGDISAVSCEAFEDCPEDGASENNHVLRIRLLGGWLRLRCREMVFG